MPPDSTSPRRPRVSLLSLLLLTGLIATSITTARLWTQNQSLSEKFLEQRVRHEALRREHGDLIVSDPTKLQACRRTAWDDPDWLWQFRLHVPDDRPYQLAFVQGDAVPATGTAVPGGQKKVLPLAAGETTASLHFHNDGSRWQVALSTPRVTDFSRFRGTPWMSWQNSVDGKTTLLRQLGGYLPEGGQAIAEDNALPFLLYRLRARRIPIGQVSQPLESPGTPAPGFILWVEPQP